MSEDNNYLSVHNNHFKHCCPHYMDSQEENQSNKAFMQKKPLLFSNIWKIPEQVNAEAEQE